MDDDRPVHRELLLPAPTKDPPEITPLVWNTSDPFWLEIHRGKEGRVRYALGSVGALELDAMFSYLESTRPRLAGGGHIECLAHSLVPDGLYARAVPTLKHHHLPIVINPRLDPADHLLRVLASRALRDHDVVLQLLFQTARGWESTFFSPLFETIAQHQHHTVRAAMNARRSMPAYHVELRTRIVGRFSEEALAAIGTWLSNWTTPGGAAWRRWRTIPPKKEWMFQAAMTDHSLNRFVSRRARRDVSGVELDRLLSIPWANHHGECSYAGAPRGHPSPDHVARASRAHPELRLAVGQFGAQTAVLPSAWNHLAILGRTQSGKSTLALSLVLQILWKEPGSTVVVIEPTGTLVDAIVSRLRPETASETIEVDPAHATFQQGDATMVSVPLSLLLPPERANEVPSARDRWSEALAGDLLAAIRSAWGEESVGGRAEFVLRALVQGLALTPGSNLVDAYQILTSKPTLQRFVRTAPPGPLRDFLEHHLPRLDYNFTMSSLDKVGKIATNPLLRIALCQRARSVSFDRLLGHRLLLLNLSKAALGADGANFLGAIHLTQLWAAVQRNGRTDRPVYLILDEVHNYAVPALADMLSEGAKFGLHVVAITQYLHRVPPRVRAALLGNLGAWLLFSLGTEDMIDAWKIVNGESHGWLPQDLVDGLRPHEVAMSVSGDLLKLDTRPSPPPNPKANELRDLVTASSRRYAQREDSEASPWLVEQETVELLLRALSTEPMTHQELSNDTPVPASRLDGAISACMTAGDLERDPNDGKYRLTPRGTFHLQALEARRNEGNDHTELLADGLTPLEGLRPRITAQGGALPQPDGVFEWMGQTYNVEVETSNLLKHPEQVVRNLRKALAAQRPCLFVVPDRESAGQLFQILSRAAPEVTLWREFGLMWKEGPANFLPYVSGLGRPWSFLTNGTRFEGGVAPPGSSVQSPSISSDSDLSRVHLRVKQLLAQGKTEATLQDFADLFGGGEGGFLERQRLGMALVALGAKSRRIRTGDGQERVYDITQLADATDHPADRGRGEGDKGNEPSSGTND
jgi:hypothetical protein